MNEEDDVRRFGIKLTKAFDRFRREEKSIRESYRDANPDDLSTESDIEYLLERTTRRYLIDPMLCALDWKPNNPSIVIEEARSWADNGGRLYLDYLGIDQNRFPVLLVEAKGADAEGARRPYAPDATGQEMAKIISEVLIHSKGCTSPSRSLKQWAQWLDDLLDYVRSFDLTKQKMLQRVVITSGQWLIIFTDPLNAFIDAAKPNPDKIKCYTSLDEIIECYEEIYVALARRRLVYTLPLTLTLEETLSIIGPISVDQQYHGVVVATRDSGVRHRQYPTRTIYPAVVLVSAGWAFAVVDYDSEPQEEPRNSDKIKDFLINLEKRTSAFVQRVAQSFDWGSINPLPLGQYFVYDHLPKISHRFPATPGSTATLGVTSTCDRPLFVRKIGSAVTDHEYLVVTGQRQFFKHTSPLGPDCKFHNIKHARADGVTSETGRFNVIASSFTTSGGIQHCEHGVFRAKRLDRCHLRNIESHLCCRVCVFHNSCWENESLVNLPCPPIEQSLSSS